MSDPNNIEKEYNLAFRFGQPYCTGQLYRTSLAGHPSTPLLSNPSRFRHRLLYRCPSDTESKSTSKGFALTVDKYDMACGICDLNRIANIRDSQWLERRMRGLLTSSRRTSLGLPGCSCDRLSPRWPPSIRPQTRYSPSAVTAAE